MSQSNYVVLWHLRRCEVLCALFHDGMMILLGSYESLNDWVADDFMMFLYTYVYTHIFTIFMYDLYMYVYIYIYIYICMFHLIAIFFMLCNGSKVSFQRQNSRNHMVLFVSSTHPLFDSVGECRRLILKHVHLAMV